MVKGPIIVPETEQVIVFIGLKETNDVARDHELLKLDSQWSFAQDPFAHQPARESSVRFMHGWAAVRPFRNRAEAPAASVSVYSAASAIFRGHALTSINHLLNYHLNY